MTSEGANGTGGVVYLVGCGPGDRGLVTERAVELVASADAILYDRLVPRSLLALAPPHCELVYVGKLPGRPTLLQEEINAELVARGRAGQRVVRLKGGDPFVFGRGGEEAEALAAAGVRFEVVPGVTAGIAAPAYAGIPVTHRAEASAVAFITAHEDPCKGESALDWRALARFPGTLVFYMGVRRLAAVSERLRAEGRSPDEPCAVVADGTRATQRTVTGTLATIAERVAAAGVQPPAVLVVGAVCALRERLAWAERRPLHGAVVVVTRARPQQSAIARRLRALGAEVVEAPAIRIRPLPPPPELATIERFGLVCLTSPNGARLLVDGLLAQGRDARALARAQIAAIGPGTAAALAERGLRADIVAERFVAEGLVEALSDVEVADRDVLIARAAEARDTLVEALAARGARVTVAPLYETVHEPLPDYARDDLERATYITFTASSTVRSFLAGGGTVPRGARVVSIGPITSAALREAGIAVDVEASRHDIDGLIEALVADARARRAVA
ncbi:MAG: uroporphyrinogen-III C-methyltransferase [Thermoleophilum sp.]|nr:uroporphyrinogen-III C-methyltransferase [Thermoleophilum sp.]